MFHSFLYVYQRVTSKNDSFHGSIANCIWDLGPFSSLENSYLGATRAGAGGSNKMLLSKVVPAAGRVRRFLVCECHWGYEICSNLGNFSWETIGKLSFCCVFSCSFEALCQANGGQAFHSILWWSFVWQPTYGMI